MFGPCYMIEPTDRSQGDPTGTPTENRSDAADCGFPLAAGGRVADLYVENSDYPGVVRAAGDLAEDLARVTGLRPRLVHDPAAPGEFAVIVGTIGRNGVVDRLIGSGRLDAADLAGKWESFVVQTVADPLPGVREALVIAGSDKRGTIFGIYDLCEQIGVSPWHWWADVPVARRTELFVRRGVYRQGEPTVKYRGIFLNDEGPSLMTWVRANFPDFTHEFYERVFELLLRLKANYLWPAMWDSSFYEDDERNAATADLYGIVVGTSHHEPMLRPHKDWKKRREGPWDYAANRETLYRFWEEGIRRSRHYESIVTLGMRGDGDEPMGGHLSFEEKMRLLQTIIDDQRGIIARYMNPDVARVPQVWALYKEVQDYYDRGMRVPDDVTLLWSDDNHGNLRRVPTPDERRRPGGAGVYYHLDYVGGPRSYKWINTVPIPKIWEQMHKAYEYGADRIWIVNVGDLKPMEFQTEFFLRLAWNVHAFTPDNLREFGVLWAERQFGVDRRRAEAIADLIARYSKWNGRLKPELLNAVPLYSWTNDKEAETVLADMRDAVRTAERLYAELPEPYKDAFFQIVLYPVKASAVVNELHMRAEKSRLYARQGRTAANVEARRAELLFAEDDALSFDYNRRAAFGKWNHMMDQTHIGYTYWNQPENNTMPEVGRVSPLPGAAMGVAVEGSEAAWLGAPEDDCVLPPFDPYSRERRYIDVFNRGTEPFAFTATADAPWIRLSASDGVVVLQKRLWVDVDWEAVPRDGRAEGTVMIVGPGGAAVTVRVRLANPAAFVRSATVDVGEPAGACCGPNGLAEDVSPDAECTVAQSLPIFVEINGCISIEAEHFAASIPAGGAEWRKIPDYGRTLSSMAVFPVTVPSARPPEGSPRLEYRVRLASTGDIRVVCYIAPSLDFIPGASLRLGVSFDDGPIAVADGILRDADGRPDERDWEQSVILNVRTVETVHRIDAPGDHTLKIWMVDPTVVLQKIVIDAGGVRPSFLGPAESPRISDARAGREPETAKPAAVADRERAAEEEAALDPFRVPGAILPGVPSQIPLELRRGEAWETDVFVKESGLYEVSLAVTSDSAFSAVLECFPVRADGFPELPPVRIDASGSGFPTGRFWLPAGEHRLRLRAESGMMRLRELRLALMEKDVFRVRPTLRRDAGNAERPLVVQIGLFNDDAFGHRYELTATLADENGRQLGVVCIVGHLARGEKDMLQFRFANSPDAARYVLTVSLWYGENGERRREWRYRF